MKYAQGIPFMVVAISITAGQVVIFLCTHVYRIFDYRMTKFGVVALLSMYMLTLAVWHHLASPDDPFRVLLCILFTVCFTPSVNVTCLSIYTRLMMEAVPDHKGVAMTVVTNVFGVSNILAYLFF